MDSTMIFIFLVVIFKVADGIQVQDAETRSIYLKIISPQCKHGPVVSIHTCCPMPNLFEEETYLPCLPSMQPFGDPALRGSPECAERTCILRNNDLLFDNDDIDRDSVRQYLEDWTSKRREYTPAVKAVKENCIGTKPMFGPDIMCDADKLIFCIHCNLYNKCPHWKDNENCTALRAYLESCMPYYD